MVLPDGALPWLWEAIPRVPSNTDLGKSLAQKLMCSSFSATQLFANVARPT